MDKINEKANAKKNRRQSQDSSQYAVLLGATQMSQPELNQQQHEDCQVFCQHEQVYQLAYCQTSSSLLQHRLNGLLRHG